DLAGLNGEADVVDRTDFFVLAAKQATDGAQQALLLLIHAIGFRQSLGFNNWHDSWWFSGGGAIPRLLLRARKESCEREAARREHGHYRTNFTRFIAKAVECRNNTRTYPD